MKTELLKPELARIVRIKPMVEDHHLFQVRFEGEEMVESFRHRPGQFVEMSVIGSGEMPISISSSPTRRGILEFCVRRVGRVTDALYRLPQNSLIGLRGPYGNGFPIEEMKGNNLLIVAGGLGMVPLRSLLWYALDNRSDFKEITLMYGCRSPEEMLFRYELETLTVRDDMDCLLTVDDKAGQEWEGNTGVVTDLFKGIQFDAENTYAAICGPPIFYKYVLQKLLEQGFSKGRILMSLERKMKCGIGKCGHCGIGGAKKLVCVDGPIFTYWDVVDMREVI